MQTINNELEVNPDISVKKKGRPRKNPIDINEDENTEQPEKKKRGRKKKEKIEEVKQKKKRGRKAALKFFSSTIRKKIPLTTIIYDNDNALLHLDIKEQLNDDIKHMTYNVLKKETYVATSNVESEEEDILCEYIDNISNDIDITELYEKRLESRLLQDKELIEKLNDDDDNILLSKLLNVNKKVEKNEEKIENHNIENIDKTSGYFNVLNDFIETTNWINKTNIACWWCCHTFESIPIGLPVDFCKNKFRVKGIFCTFACMIAYNNDNKNKNSNIKAMIYSLYKKLTGESVIKDNVITSLNPAPNRCTLKIFGGKLSIEEFRSSSTEQKIYKMIEYPMFISRDYMEEVDLFNLKKVNKNVFDKQYTIQSNNMNDKKLEEVKTRINSNVVVTNNSMDRFLKW